MPAGDPAHKRATLDDFLRAQAEGRRVEIIDGVLADKEAAGSRHGGAHVGIPLAIGPFRGRGDGDRPGGWVFKIDADITAPAGDIVSPDVSGWRRERAPPDDVYPIAVAPDWVCEIACSSLVRDVGRKQRTYHAMGVTHSWIVDLKNFVLTVYRRDPNGYLLATAVGPDERVRLEPFDAIELCAWELFGLEDPPSR